MIQIRFDSATKVAKLAQATTIKLGADVPVQVVFSAAPGDVDSLQLTLGTDAAVPSVLAFTETFSQENDTTWTALLDASDTRLAAHMATIATSRVLAELVAQIDGARLVCPNLPVTVQTRILNGPGTSEGGPVYLTDAQIAAAIAATLPRSFVAAIPLGASSVTVGFDPAFSAPPSIYGVTVEKADAADPDLAVAGVHALSANSVVVDLFAAAPTDTYFIHVTAR